MRSLTFLALLAATPFALADKVDDAVRAEMKRMNIPGLVLGIVKRGKLVETRAYGKANLELDVKMPKDAVGEIGSTTKQFTAVATMLLVEDGKLSLDDPVSKWIPEAPASWKDITLRHLLYQTSGLQDYAFVPGIGLIDEFDRAKWFSSMTPLPLDFAPGVTWAYSNSNYALLGWIIEKASGKPYADFVTERILKPAGMNDTRYAAGEDLLPHRASGYMFFDHKFFRSRAFSGSIQSDGTLNSTVADLAKWVAVLRDRKLLKPSSYDLLWARARLNSGRTRPYGMGFFLSPLKGAQFIGHHGASPGYGAGLGMFPEKDLAVVTLFNVYPGNGEAIVRAAAEAIDPSLKFPVVQPAANDPDPARTARLREALTALGKGDANAEYLEAEVYAPMKTQRAGMGGGMRPLQSIKELKFASAEPYGDDTLMTYQIVVPDRTFSATIVWTKTGKIAQFGMRPDPK